jgi:uncharacterized NAD-dependent epimerase/dehydratase family protein
VKSLVIGVAPVGGVVPEPWWAVITEAAEKGLDIVCGLHIRLGDRADVAAAAQRSGAQLIDVRRPPAGLPVGSGRKRTGRRVLVVGPDCAIGKKYTALSLHRAMLDAGMNSTFRATGQTGIMIAGEGIAIDAVVADFVSGAAEVISPDNSSDHWDVIEGQGSVFHPGYAGVSLGLLHGSQPDAIVVAWDPLRQVVDGWPDYPLPSLEDCIDLHLRLGGRTNPDVRCAGISVNTSRVPQAEREALLQTLSERTGLPCADPLKDSMQAIAEKIRSDFP